MDLSTGELVASAIGVLGIVAAVLAARAYGSRRRRVSFYWEATQLIPEHAGKPNSALQVTYHGREVVQPHLVSLSLVNLGPTDLATNHFDAGQSLEFRLGATLFGISKESHPGRTLMKGTTEPRLELEPLLLLPPGLLKRGEEWFVEAVVGGVPDVTLSSSLIDTDLVDRDLRRATALQIAEDALGRAPLGFLILALFRLVMPSANRAAAAERR